jgi:hypothetical protein
MKFTIDNAKKAQSDPKLKEEGVVHQIAVPGFENTLPFRLRSSSSNVARMWEQKRFREQRHLYLNDSVPPIEVLDKNDADKIAEALLLEWPLVKEDGTPEPLDRDSVRAAMMQLPDLRFDLIQASNRKDAYRLQEVTAIAKNSDAPSPTTSVTAAGA